MELQLLDLDLAIAKLSEVINLDQISEKSRFFSFTKTDDEISLVVESAYLPEHQFANTGWKGFKIFGPLDFSLVGILQQVIQPLAENNISIFALSTFDTDYILVKSEQVERAKDVLKSRFTIV